MATTIDYASDYGGKASDYQATMNVLEGYKACPMMICGGATIQTLGVSGSDVLRMFGCIKGVCAWWDAEKERCAVLSLARNK